MDSYNETVFDFDLNFLQQQSKDTLIKNGNDKQRKAVAVAKKKIIATNSLIEKFYAKREQFEEVERALLLSREECKKVCIDYRNAMEKCARFEHESQVLQSANRSLQERLEQAENAQGGIQCHVKQLQVLIKEYETKFEEHTSNVQAEKKKAKENDKKRLCMQKENEELVKNLSLISSAVLGKEKITKKLRLVLKKYSKKSTDSEDSDEADNLDGDTYGEPIFSVPTNDITKTTNSIFDVVEDVIIEKKEGKSPKDLSDQDSDCANEVVSEDTGRGSSLAFSDSDKCFNSPDYFVNDSPLSNETLKHKATQSAFTSPTHKTIDCASSPIFIYDSATAADILNVGIDQATSPIRIVDKKQASLKSPLKNYQSIDKATSPHSLFKTKVRHLTCSLVESAHIAINPTEESHKNNHTTPKKTEFSISGISPLHTSSESKLVKHKQILGSSTLSDDIVSDTEIEMILNEMRLSHNFITPLPATPSRSSDSVNEQTVVQHECLDAKKVMAENKKIHENVANLTKEILSIKNLLIKQQVLCNVPDSLNDSLHDRVSNILSPLATQNEDVNRNHEEVPIPDTIPSIQIISPVMSPVRNSSDIDHGVETEEDIEFDISDSENTNNYSVQQRLEFEDPDESYVCPSNDTSFENNNVVGFQPNDNVKIPPRKLTRLEKFRKKMLPKSKIKPTETISKKLKERRLKYVTKKMEPPVVKKVTEKDTAESLNDKTIYEKALHVMKELKSKSCTNTNKLIPKRKLRNQTKVTAKCIDDNKSEETSPDSSRKTRSQSKNVLQTNMNNSPVVKNNNVIHQSDEKSPTHDLLNSINKKRSSKALSIKLTDVLDNADTHKASSPVSTNPDKQLNMPAAVSETKRRLKRKSVEVTDFSPKRKLRSSTISESEPATDVEDVAKNGTDVAIDTPINTISIEDKCPVAEKPLPRIERSTVDYSDMFTENTADHSDMLTDNDKPHNKLRKDRNRKNGMGSSGKNILCAMIEKHGMFTLLHSRKNIPETIIDSTYKKIEDTISKIIDLPATKTNDAMNKFVDEVRAMNWKHFILGLLKYLKDPERKNELYKKVNSPPAPPMTKNEQILLYVVIQMQASSPTFDAVDSILKNIEYTLFALNRTPDFDTIESMSHFYAIICRYFKAKSRLRLFIIDAMYCIQFKSVTLIKQCLDVWMHVLPLAHMGIAKSTLVTCLVYLLHFYKCEDKFNKVQDIRQILNRKYFYEMSEWNETKILEVFTTAISDLRDITIERKMLRMALIILAKRNGARWCQNNVVKKLLQPLIAKEDVPDRIKIFCVSMLGPLLKPYPANMKVHCEIVLNQLIELLKHNPSDRMTEAIFSSLMSVSKHNPNSVLKAFLSWNPLTISADFEAHMRDFVRERNIKTWKITLSKIAMEERNKELYYE